ncbi:MAG TPA: hypothetical protein PLN69_10110 [bacterium]|nr:hypothetical protein [bacterium]
MKKIVIITALALILTPLAALATTTQEVDLDFEIPQIVDIDWSVDGSSVQLTGASAITVDEFDAGYKDNISGGTLECTANEAFDITVEAAGVTFTGGSGTKAVTTMYVDVDAAGTYANQMQSGATPVTIIDEQPATQNELHTLKYKINLYSDDSPGTYATTLTYTILVD